MNHLTKIITKEFFQETPITVIDCGARGALEKSRWKDWLAPVTIYGFDADNEECNIIKAQEKTNNITYKAIPSCLSNSSKDNVPFYITANPGGNSLYKPNEKFAKRLKHIENNKVCSHYDNVRLSKIEPINTSTLDEWAKNENIHSIDFIKLDLQGAELNTLQGAEELLTNCLAIEVEVEFVHMYFNQPLFADVDIYLRSQDFVFYNFLYTHGGHYAGRVDSPITIKAPPNFPSHTQKIYGQLLSADAYYMRDVIADNTDTDLLQLLKLICFSEINGQVEYSFELLSHCFENLNFPTEKLKEISNKALEEYQKEWAMKKEMTELKRRLTKNHFLQYLNEEISNEPHIKENGLALYGAGKHTEWLLNEFNNNSNLITCIIDDNAYIGQEICNIPVLKPEDLSLSSISAILLSSDSQENNLHKRCMELFPEQIRIIAFYSVFEKFRYDNQ
ncbi:MAG: FkbM family methyltransferase [Lentisphaeraceae bacterium]|nr:FkbM family methyltransferase [Lentisphaeraceae bacterium]